MFSQERNEIRNMFFNAWQKHLKKLPVEPLEAQLIEVMVAHPEYHALLSDPKKLQTENLTISNPFLHMGLHLALREQVSTDRPTGIKVIYQNLCKKYHDSLTAEHKMMERLEKILWEAQNSGKMPDEESYLNDLRGI